MADAYIFTRVLYLIVKICVMLYIKPISEVLKLVTPKSSSKLKRWDMSKVIRCVDFFFIWPIPPFHPGLCLKRSLVLYKFLRENGIEVKINIGIKKETKNIHGHAWLTLDGKPYLTRLSSNENFASCFIFPA